MKRNAIRWIGSFVLVAALALSLIPSGVAKADEMPTPPHAFYGTLQTNTGSPASIGVTVIALIDGRVAGRFVTTEAGRYGGPDKFDPKLIVQGDFDYGSPIIFYVAGIVATPSDPSKAVFDPREIITELNLTYTPPPPPPTPTPTPGPGPGPGPGAPTPDIEITIDGDTFNYEINEEGVIQETVHITTPDGELEIIISEGTTALDEDGNPLEEINITVDEDPPDPPEGSNIIALPYNLEPKGATFDPPITLTFHYDDLDIPEGVDEEELVIAYYDEDLGEWVVLECVVDPDTNTITAFVSHFTTFAIIAYTSPAVFVASNLTLSVTEVNIGEELTISILITNTGNLRGIYEAVLKIDNTLVDSQEITLAGGERKMVTFTTASDVPGTYTISVDGLSATFLVKAAPEAAVFTISGLSISPAEVNIGETVTISVIVTNTGDLIGTYKVTLKIDNLEVSAQEITLDGGKSQTVTFTAAKDVPGTYSVDVNGVTGTFKVKEKVTPPPTTPTGPEINWVIIGGVIGGVIIIILLIYFLAVRRRA